MKPRAFAAVAIGAAVLGMLMSCASRSTGTDAAAAAGGPSISQPSLPVLAATVLPSLTTKERRLPAAELAKDATLPGVVAQLYSDNYVGGRERTFQGPSRHLTFVASRTLAFRDRAGAAAFLSYVRANADSWFGGATQVAPIASAQGSGYEFEPPLCSCHLANPVLVGVVQDGARLSWLEINGPDATRLLLLDLMTPSNEERTP